MAALDESGNGFLTGLLEGVLADADAFGDPVGDIARNLDPLHQATEQVAQLLLADVTVPAAAAEPGAPVVHVAAFLFLRGNCATAATAGQESHEGVLLSRVPRTWLPIQNVLNLLESLTGHEGRMRAPVQLAEPPEITDVDQILEDAVDLGLHHPPA